MRLNKDSSLFSKPIAHRGLWGEGVIENSLTAYQNAVDSGYPIEIDVYLTTDGHLVSFHDKSLERMTGDKGFVYEKPLAELMQLRLNGSDCKIPTLEQVLSVVDGKVPLLIEIKNQKNKKVVDILCTKLNNYKGEFAVQSFNPFYLMRLKKIAPDFLRGVLATEYAQGESAIVRYVLRKMPFNKFIKPDFISYSYSGLPLKKSLTKKVGVLCWTITDQQTLDKVSPYCDNFIFEHFIPKEN